MKSTSLSQSGLLLKVDCALCVCVRSVAGVGPASHVKSAQEQKCLLGEYCLSGWLGGGGGLSIKGEGCWWIIRVQFECFVISVSLICFGICYFWP